MSLVWRSPRNNAQFHQCESQLPIQCAYNSLYFYKLKLKNIFYHYQHDLIVSKMVLSDIMLKKTPFPTGSYMFQLIAGNPKWQGITQIMTDIVET